MKSIAYFVERIPQIFSSITEFEGAILFISLMLFVLVLFFQIGGIFKAMREYERWAVKIAQEVKDRQQQS